MDIISHGLFAYSIVNKSYKSYKIIILSLLLGAVIPDIGEIPIQAELSKKYGVSLAVYDERTSDISVASNLQVTFVYDILHSLLFPLVIYLLSHVFSKIRLPLRFFSIGQLTHIFLDSFTHGKVWALKLFYPINPGRVQILSKTIGNWWDWQPKLDFYFFDFPLYCIIFWILLIYVMCYSCPK